MSIEALKNRLLIYSKLMRIDRPIGTLLLLWPTLSALWIASDGTPSITYIAIFICGTFLTRSAGCVINDYADRDIDEYVERTRQRPFAQRLVSEKEALCLAAGLMVLALVMVLQLNRLTLYLSIIAFLIAVSYPYTKRFFPIPQAYLGLAFSFGIPMAFSALQNRVPITAWWLMLATGLWIVAYDTTYALTDKPDDLKIGIHSAAITFGHHVIRIIMLCHSVFITLMVLLGWWLSFGLAYFISLILAIWLIIRQYHDLCSGDRTRYFTAFLANNRVGMIIFLGIVIQYCQKP